MLDQQSNMSNNSKSKLSKLGSMPRLNDYPPRSSREDILTNNDALSRRKEELKRKRGMLELNSDLEVDLDYRVPPQARMMNDAPSNMVGFRSKYHKDLKRENLDAKMA